MKPSTILNVFIGLLIFTGGFYIGWNGSKIGDSPEAVIDGSKELLISDTGDTLFFDPLENSWRILGHQCPVDTVFIVDTVWIEGGLKNYPEILF